MQVWKGLPPKGNYTQLVALIATPETVIGVCAFGHGGTIVAGGGMQDWTQRVNDQENKIKSPLKTMQNAEDVLTKAMQTLGLVVAKFIGIILRVAVGRVRCFLYEIAPCLVAAKCSGIVFHNAHR